MANSPMLVLARASLGTYLRLLDCYISNLLAFQMPI